MLSACIFCSLWLGSSHCICIGFRNGFFSGILFMCVHTASFFFFLFSAHAIRENELPKMVAVLVLMWLFPLFFILLFFFRMCALYSADNKVPHTKHPLMQTVSIGIQNRLHTCTSTPFRCISHSAMKITCDQCVTVCFIKFLFTVKCIYH